MAGSRNRYSPHVEDCACSKCIDKEVKDRLLVFDVYNGESSRFWRDA